MADVSPLSPVPFIGFTITLPDDVTIVEPDPAPYNNTKEIVILNLSETDAAFVRILDVGEPPVIPADPTLVQASNSTQIPAGASFSLCIGTESQRHAIRSTAGWASGGPGSQFVLAFRAATGTNVDLNITYIQSIGGASGP